jgi:thiamine biosynthesis lipoprotein
MTMTTTPAVASPPASWRPVDTGDTTVAVAQRHALGTTARLAVWPPENAGPAMTAVDEVLSSLDLQASRFRPDSEISWVHRAHGGLYMLSDGLAEAVRVALAAAAWTGGLADPTVGAALIALGYDRDFAALDPDRREPAPGPVPAPGWQSVRLDGPLLHLPAGVLLDLGATAKGLGSDRAARAVQAVTGMSAAVSHGGVLVSLGGDLATGGTPPAGGWPVLVADGPGPAQLVRLACGGLATSSITCRQWRRAGQAMHHIVDPRTGLPADGPWQTVSVAAATCADANAAATAAVVAGDQAEQWLAAAGLPARLVDRDGGVRYTGGWPEADGGRLQPPAGSHVYRGAGPRGGAR